MSLAVPMKNYLAYQHLLVRGQRIAQKYHFYKFVAEKNIKTFIQSTLQKNNKVPQIFVNVPITSRKIFFVHKILFDGHFR